MASPAPLAYSSSASADWPGSDCMPVLLLKTRSFPHDPYQELFSTYSLPSASPSPPTSSTIEASFDDGAVRLPPFVPYFVPVLAHRFDHDGTARLRALLHARQIGPHADCVYGGLIFTSQRAVEALADVISDTLRETADGDNPDWPCLNQVPIYSVGSATTRALQAVPHHTPLRVFGDHCGNGDALAHFILDHYSDWYRHHSVPPPLLFLVGEQRRDIISRTLMDPSRPPSQRVLVDEEVVYRTAVMESFPQDFAVLLRQTERAPVRWIVVFSPTGCDSMLRGIDMLDPATRRAPPAPSHASNTLIATIGPTTRAHLIEIFAFEPHVCADSPSPEGVLQAIVRYMRRPVKSCLTDATT